MAIRPRIRTVKPEFWSDEDLGICSDSARLLAVALLNFSDSSGFFNSNPANIRASIFPHKDISKEDVENLVQELVAVNYILLYDASDKKRYGKVRTFEKHQVIRISEKGEKASEIKGLIISTEVHSPFPGISPGKNRESRNFPGGNGTERNGSGAERNGTGKERNGTERYVNANVDDSLCATTASSVFVDAKSNSAILAEKIQLVFDHWAFTCTKSRIAVLSDRRKEIITAALRDYDEQFLCQAISGCKTIPHNNGQNKNGKKYLALDLILRNNENIERFQRALSEREETAEEKLLQKRINCAKIIEGL